ncbi:GAF domain-containing protein [Adhaeribacter swui]|uniref:GAF domain-containing protein n=1 Tax=Adhaeribacter swui TaxID=2086471 RepID=A0A7G7G628_9BACT|nr:GAF domain-containing protein [Adhaeribacter swui]QNF32612.1 GAF domain-containing protein [Adhaeribacter swui]
MNRTFDQPLIPANESERLRALRRITSTNQYQENGTFKHVAAMAARMFEVPIALVNLVEEHQVITMAGVGQAVGTEVPREISLCSLSILDDQVTFFKDAKNEPCLLANPMVHGEFGLQFYAAAPLKTKLGINIGALCIVDKTPRTFSEIDQRILENLATIVMDELEKVAGTE